MRGEERGGKGRGQQCGEKSITCVVMGRSEARDRGSGHEGTLSTHANVQYPGLSLETDSFAETTELESCASHGQLMRTSARAVFPRGCWCECWASRDLLARS